MNLRKKVMLIAGIILFIGVVVVIYFNFNKPKSNWVCLEGKWVNYGEPAYPKPENPCGQKISLPKNQEDCAKIDGSWKKLGPDPFETCNVKAKDRGTICHDSSECSGMCQVDLTKEELSEGMRGKIFTEKKHGQCSVWVVELGCRGIMKDGKAQVICIN
jgi:hypothetical protein